MPHSLLETIQNGLVTWALGHASASGIPPVVVEMLAWVLSCVVVITVILLSALVGIYLERKIAGYIQSRLGPMEVGPKGIFQTAMDALKLLTKEDIIPVGADRVLHLLGPLIFFAAGLMAFAVIPWDRSATPAAAVDLNVGLLYLIAVSSLGIIALVMSGWGSNNKWSLLGALRSVAQSISYEIPMLLAVLCVVLQTGSMSLAEISKAQDGGVLQWNIAHWWLWLPALLYLITATAEVNRTPFDLPDAESELVAGYHTEYSGMKFAMFFLAEYMNVLAVGLVGATLFLGGYCSPLGHADPGIPGPVWLLAKAWAIIILLMWVRWTLPRLRIDQLMAFGWNVLIPAGFVSIFVTAGVMLVR
jgi:NADH-quinone oxidoreductase subunit H